MGVADALGAVSGAFGAVGGMVLPVAAPVYAVIVWLLNEISSAFSVYVFGTCIGLLLGATAVAAMRGSLARADAEATRKAKVAAADARKSRRDGAIPPLPIPPDVLAEALRHLPRWTKEPDVSRASWLNNLLDALWPHVDTSVSQVIRDSLEPTLRSLVPPLVSWIGFEKVTLGPNPPVVGGVKVMGSNSEEVMLELEVVIASGADVVLAAYVFGVRVPVRVHDLQLRANVRVTFTPLVDALPCLGGLEVSLMSLPQHADVGVSIPPGIDLMSLPGAHSLLRLALWKFVAPLMVYPAKMTIPIMENSGIEPQSTGMIKLSVLGGQGFAARTKLFGSGAGATSERRATTTDGGVHPRSSFPKMPLGGLNSLVASRYLVQLHTRESRKITLASKSSDAPTWDETHHFLTNPDACLTATVMTTNLKELGRCEIPLRRLVADDRARKTTLLHIPLGDPKPYLVPVPVPKKPVSQLRVTQEELDALAEDHEMALEKHALELATLRVNALDAATRPSPLADVPVITCELEYTPLGLEVSSGKKEKTSSSNDAKPDSGSESASESGDFFDADERRGILTVFVTRGVHVLSEATNGETRPCATATCAGQTYTTEAPLEKTKNPIWDEEFLFFNVAPSETLRLDVRDGTAKGEFLGGFDLDVREVAANKELSEMFRLTGVSNAAHVFLKARFAYMS